MKDAKKVVVFLLTAISLCMTTFITAAAQYGAAMVKENQTYTLSQMLTYALEDEYLANARYTIDMEKFPDQRIFSRIAEAEKRHIGLLKPILVKYGIPVPEDRGAQFVIVPQTLTAAIQAGIDGERNNLRMYTIFLERDLPEDVRMTVNLLRGAAARHLRAFQRNLLISEETR